MFLHSGASLHGHEYSSRPPPAALPSPLLRSAFPPPKQRAAGNRTLPNDSSAPVLRQRPASDYIPRDSSPVVRFREPHVVDEDDDDNPPPPTPSAHDESAPVSESEYLSDAALSVDGASGSRPGAVSSRHRKGGRRSVRKSSTTYYLGYPAPRIIGKAKVVQKVLRPRLLLQLQVISAEGRLQPILEVFPAARIAGPVAAPRLAKLFPAILGVKRHLGYDDVVLVRRDDGDSDEESDDEAFEGRNLLAVYSPLKHSEEAEIVLDDGSVWVARPLPNGSFDFVHTNAEGKTITARWARRHGSGTTAGDSTAQTNSPPRYTFSIINPLTRRHPVMATLTPSTLDIQDTYTSVSASHAKRPPITRTGRSQSLSGGAPVIPRSVPSSPSSVSVPTSGCPAECENDSAVCIPTAPSDPDAAASPRTTYPVDDATKMLIAVSAIWVCLRSSWHHEVASACIPPPSACSTTSAPDCNAANSTATSANSNQLSSSTRSRQARRNTWTTRHSTPEPPSLDQPPTPNGTTSPLPKRSSMPIPFFSHHHHHHHHHFWEPSSPTTGPTSRGPSPSPAGSRAPTPTSFTSTAGTTQQRRATSSGAAFMQRMLKQAAAAAAGVGSGGENKFPDLDECGGSTSGKDEHPPPSPAAPTTVTRKRGISISYDGEQNSRRTAVAGKGDLANWKAEMDREKNGRKELKGILKTPTFPPTTTSTTTTATNSSSGNRTAKDEKEKAETERKPRPVSEGFVTAVSFPSLNPAPSTPASPPGKEEKNKGELEKEEEEEKDKPMTLTVSIADPIPTASAKPAASPAPPLTPKPLEKENKEKDKKDKKDKPRRSFMLLRRDRDLLRDRDRDRASSGARTPDLWTESECGASSSLDGGGKNVVFVFDDVGGGGGGGDGKTKTKTGVRAKVARWVSKRLGPSKEEGKRNSALSAR
ncbi:hypothetical protein VTJ04DRAFT_6621 [Mycothermus thermophilus]|uniref:uncharacterized protein n=1 Tax=Humicola insolens TaxID=85995 RepID=UPI0037424E3E